MTKIYSYATILFMTDPELQKMIKQTFEIAKANHGMLKKIRRHQRWETFTKILYWIVILIIVVGGYLYVVQPLTQRVFDTYANITASVEGLQGAVGTVSGATENVTGVFGNLSDLLGGESPNNE